MQAMQLESKSTPTGFLDVIAVGTAINQGEDATVKGAVSLCMQTSVQKSDVKRTVICL